jgi:hypothetical protein
MSRPLRVTALSAAMLGALALTGCGGGNGGDDGSHEPTSAFGRQTAAQISEAVRTDMKGVRSVTIDGTTKDATVHLSLADDGSCTGTVEPASGGKASVVEDASGSYVRGDAAYWTGQASTDADRKRVEQALRVWDGRWVKSPRSGGYLLPQCDFATFLPLLSSGDRKLAVKGDEREVAGVDAVALTADQGGVKSTLWVSTDAPHRIVRLTEAGSGAVYTLSHYDEPVSIQTPDPAEVYDLAAANKKKAE